MQNIPTKQYVAVDLPLFYKSEESLNRIIEPYHQFNNVLLKRLTKLPIKLNPNDLNCRILNGEPHKCAGILMKVKVSKKSKKIVSTEILGKGIGISFIYYYIIVPTKYTFDKLADFTYTSCFSPLEQTENGYLFDIEKTFNSNIKDINIIPPIFAMDNVVYNSNFNRNGKVIDGEQQQQQQQHPMYKQASNHSSTKSCIYYDFNSESMK